MDHAQRPESLPPESKVIDFDAALLDALPPALRADVLTEAGMLAQAFAPDGRGDQLRGMAEALSSGVRDAEMGRVRARQLAAALRHLAREAD